MNISLIKIKQKFHAENLKDISKEVEKEFYRIGLNKQIRPGMKIAITAGSRGIDQITEILKSIIKEVKKIKGDPFIVTAMGSHGGANAEGQRKLLRDYAITEESMGVHIRSTMETIEIGQLKNGLPVYFDKFAYHADGIIIVNRVKVHTAFKAEIESGLHKMLSVGLGNHKGATLVHSMGVKGIRDYMLESAKVILKKAPVIAGFGILENAYDQTYKIMASKSQDFEQNEKEILRECKELLPRLPTKEVDILFVQEMGKNISGTGMDTNVVGGIYDYNPAEYMPPKIKKIIVGDLTLEADGNALGVGIAHLITKRLYNKIDFQSTYKNTITTTFLDRARIPIVVENDKEAIEICLKTICNLPNTNPRVMIIKNTLKLDEMYVSEAIWEEIKNHKNIDAIGAWESMKFNASGELLNRI